MTGSKQLISQATLFRYGITGIGTAVVYVAAGAILHYRFGMAVTWATSLAFALSVICNYLLHYYFTFEPGGGHATAIPRYLAMIAGGGAINWGISEFGYALVPSLPAVQAASVVLIVSWNFACSCFWVFRQ